MNHKETYNRIIENRRQNPLSTDEYGENHHIIPKSEGGSDDKSNLVKLTAREHYICHLLLAKIYNDSKMYAAVLYMQCKSEDHKREFRFNSHLYAKMRIAFSESMKGRKVSDETRKKMSEAMKGEKNGFYNKKHTDEVKRKISEANKGRNKGKHLSKETRRKMSESRKGRKLSEEHRQKISEAHKNPSEETRRKIGEARKGRKHSEESRQKISEATKGKHWYNNGIKNVLMYECLEGFVEGRLKF